MLGGYLTCVVNELSGNKVGSKKLLFLGNKLLVCQKYIETDKEKSNQLFVLCVCLIHNSLKNNTISYMQRAIPPNIVMHIVNIAINLKGCIWIIFESRIATQKSENKNKHNSII
jgi:hypothetical protein